MFVYSRLVSPLQRCFRRQMPSFTPSYLPPQILKDCMDVQGNPLMVYPCLGEVSMPTISHTEHTGILSEHRLSLDLYLYVTIRMMCGNHLLPGSPSISHVVCLLRCCPQRTCCSVSQPCSGWKSCTPRWRWESSPLKGPCCGKAPSTCTWRSLGCWRADPTST